MGDVLYKQHMNILDYVIQPAHQDDEQTSDMIDFV